MSYCNLFIGEALIFVLFFFGTRMVNLNVINYRLNGWKKRAKGQSFWDWLFYRRFRDVMTWPFWVMYFGHWIYSVLTVLLIVIMYLFAIPYDITRFCWVISLLPYFAVSIVLIILTEGIGRLFTRFNFSQPNMNWVNKKARRNKDEKK